MAGKVAFSFMVGIAVAFLLWILFYNPYQLFATTVFALLVGAFSGALLLWAWPTRQWKCPYCAEKVQSTAKICPHCGRALLPPVPHPVQPPDYFVNPHRNH
jgi:hypothetical protein